MTRARTGLPADPAGSGHTGRQLVLLKEGTGRAGAEILRNATGLRMAVSSDFDGSVRQTRLAPGEGMVFGRPGAGPFHRHPVHPTARGAALLHGDPDHPPARGAPLQALLQSFAALVAPARDVGAGLVQAPQ